MRTVQQCSGCGFLLTECRCKKKPTMKDSELARQILVGMMSADILILEKGGGKRTPEIQAEIIRLYKVAVKAVKEAL